MNYLRMFLIHTRLMVAEYARIPAYCVPTLLMPVMVYAFFGLPFAHTEDSARILLASYAAFAVIGVALFQFGVGIANERPSSWEGYVRTLPGPSTARFLARLASALLFAFVSALLVAVLASTAGHAHVTFAGWARLAGALFSGGIVFGLMGLAIGYWASPKSALPLANIVYLPLAFVGGLWMPPQMLPSFVAAISPFTPTRQYGELVWASVLGTPWSLQAVAIIAGYAVLFFALALWGYRRDEGVRYS